MIGHHLSKWLQTLEQDNFNKREKSRIFLFYYCCHSFDCLTFLRHDIEPKFGLNQRDTSREQLEISCLLLLLATYLLFDCHNLIHLFLIDIHSIYIYWIYATWVKKNNKKSKFCCKDAKKNSCFYVYFIEIYIKPDNKFLSMSMFNVFLSCGWCNICCYECFPFQLSVLQWRLPQLMSSCRIVRNKRN